MKKPEGRSDLMDLKLPSQGSPTMTAYAGRGGNPLTGGSPPLHSGSFAKSRHWRDFLRSALSFSAKFIRSDLKHLLRVSCFMKCPNYASMSVGIELYKKKPEGRSDLMDLRIIFTSGYHKTLLALSSCFYQGYASEYLE